VYGDFEISGLDAIEKASYQPGLAMTGTWTSSGSANTTYYHTDHLGTTRFMTDNTGAMVDSSVYSSFGERITGANPRYGYVGAFGYQAHDEFAFHHVGHRYYEASTGRFLQRDPIGIGLGEINVYAYVMGRPTQGIDPLGLGFWSAIGGAISGAISGAATGAISGAVVGFIAGGPAGAVAGAAAGAAGGAVSGAIAGAVAGGTTASSFGGGAAKGAVAGGAAGIGGGAVGGAVAGGAGVAGIAAAGGAGGAIGAASAAAAIGASSGGIAAAAVTGGAFGTVGGIAGAEESSIYFITSCVLEANASLWGGIFGR